MPDPETQFNFGDTPETIGQERRQIAYPLDLPSEGAIKSALPKLLRDIGPVELNGSLTVKPIETTLANTGAQSPTSNSEPGEDSPITAGQPWTNPGNAVSSNDVYATADQTAEAKYQIWKGFGLFSLIPEGATITGIEVNVEGKVSSGTGHVVAKLSKDGSVGAGNTKNDVNSWGTSDAIGTMGDPTDLWNTTWSRSDFGANFGVIIFGSTVGSLTYSLDHVTVTVHHTIVADSSIDSNIIPSVDDVYSIGSPSLRYSVGNFREIVVDDLTKISIETTDVTIVNTEVETDLIAILVRGGTLGTDKGIRVQLYFNDLKAPSSSAHGFRLRWRYGSTIISQPASLTPGTAAIKGSIDIMFLANAATNAQEMSAIVRFGPEETNISNTYNQITQHTLGTSTEDSTTDLFFRVTFQWNNGTSLNTVTMSHAVIEKIQ